MSQEQAKYLCRAARDAIDAGIAQGWALSFPTSNATLLIAANYLAAASGELGGHANLARLGGETAARASEILAFIAIPWPFTYAAIGPWANALGTIKSQIPDIAILQAVSGPAGAVAPVFGVASNALGAVQPGTFLPGLTPLAAVSVHGGSGRDLVIAPTALRASV